ncbi:MAG: GPR endopeptidase [Clostridia bacterium]|nr:GPR endopeptidase [Clostridia bacterium]MBQ9988459.1 GPR endopeptidase [Clostridia bacterium]
MINGGRTDLAVESAQSGGSLPNGVTLEKERHNGAVVETVQVTSMAGAAALQKPIGQYITVYLKELSANTYNPDEAWTELLANKIRPLLPCDSRSPVLVVGMGNRNITADSIGPLTTEKLLVSRHIVRLLPNALPQSARSVCALSPGVLGETGMETGEIVRALVNATHAGSVIAIDALAARDPVRLCTTIQISNAGIAPGAGVGNNRPALTKDSIGVPVIAIGVPTVVCVPMEETETELVVTPKDIDVIAQRCADLIANAVNRSVHSKAVLEELQTLLS